MRGADRLKKKMPRLVQVAILAVILVIGGYAVISSLDADADSLLKVGEVPPDFTLPSLNGETRSLADYKGKALVLNFWGTFCPPCVVETPEFERQYEKWAEKEGRNFAMVGINLSEDSLTVKNFVEDYGVTYDILRDKDRQIERRFGLRQYPTTFFIKPDGTIMEVYVGGMTEQAISERINKLLSVDGGRS
jgi:peroxiredoxin